MLPEIIPFHNYDPINDQLQNIVKTIGFITTHVLNTFLVYLISEANFSNTFNLLICLKRNRLWVMNVINDRKLIISCSNNENGIQLKIYLDIIIHEGKKIAKSERKYAENSTCLHQDSLEIKTVKLQGNASVIFYQLQ